MKPNFALNLTHESIGLLHRTSRGWLEVGIAELDAPDLGDALTYLRRSALGLSPAGFTTKLIIPNSQILYDEVEAPGPDDAARREQIKVALEGRTPYAVDDLVFDWSGSGPVVKVAVVARETLDEAEQFGAQYKFHPVSFVSIPDEGAFDGEPWFGPTRHSKTALPEGEVVERDADALVIVAREIPRQEKPVAAVPEEPVAEKVAEAPAEGAGHDSLPAVTDDGEELAAADTAKAPGAVVEVEKAEGTTAPVVAAEEAAAEPSPVPEDSEATPAPEVAEPVATEAGHDEAVAAEAEALTVPAADQVADARAPEAAEEITAEVLPDPEDQPKAAPEAKQAEDEAPVASSVAEPDGTITSAEEPAPAVEDAAPQAAPAGGASAVTDPVVAEPPAAPTFSSRRKQAKAGDKPDEEAKADEAAKAEAGKPGKDASIAPLPAPAARMKGRVDPPIAARTPVGAMPAGARSPKVTTAAVTAPGIPGLSPDRKLKSTGPVTDPRAGLAASGGAAQRRTTEFSGLGSRVMAQRGKPRYLGLILTGVLLLLLAVVAAVSSFYIASRDDAVSAETAIATAEVSATGDPTASTPVIAPPAIDDEMLADGQDPEAFAAAEDVEQTAAPLVTEPADVTPPANDVAPEPRPETVTEAAEAEPTEGEVAIAALDAPAPDTPPTRPEAGEPSETATLAGPDSGEATDTTLSSAGAPAEIADPVEAAAATDAPPVDEAGAEPVVTAAAEPEAVTGDGPETEGADADSVTAEPQPDVTAGEGTETAAVAAEPSSATDATAAAEDAPPPEPAVQDEIFLSTMDTPPAGRAAVTLPVPQAGPDGLPAAQLAPPPFGTQYQFDADGRIRPTPEGVITPDGVTLVAGKPVKVPPPRPEAVSAAAAAAAQSPAPVATPEGATPPEAATGASTAGSLTPPGALATGPLPAGLVPPVSTPPDEAVSTYAADPSLADDRPRSRPAGLTPPAGATPPAEDDAALDVPSGTQLAGSRPQERPEGVIDIAASARDATAAASLATAAQNGPVSPLAIALSGRPAPRPDNFAKAVEAAVAAAVRETPPEEEPTQQATLRVVRRVDPTPEEEPAAASPEADEEPEADNSGPVRISGTVAKKATFANAYNLSKTGLIGVFGTSSSRRALIRQSNGRYKTLEVGDRFDGGVVAAITADEVRYKKGGRIYALTVPSG